MKIRHIMLRVYDLEKSLEFYQKVLGLKILDTRDVKGAKMYYLAKESGDPMLILCYNFHHPEKYTHGTHFGNIGYQVDSIKEFGEKLASLGIEFERNPFDGPDGLLAFIKDPDGHFIELIEVD